MKDKQGPCVQARIIRAATRVGDFCEMSVPNFNAKTLNWKRAEWDGDDDDEDQDPEEAGIRLVTRTVRVDERTKLVEKVKRKDSTRSMGCDDVPMDGMARQRKGKRTLRQGSRLC